MELAIISPHGVVCHTEAESVTLPGSEGSFTILRNHAPIMAVLVKGDIVYKNGGEEYRVAVTSGFVNVAHNKVEVCVE